MAFVSDWVDISEGGRVYQPSAWATFGVMDPQGADFRACQNFGPVYGQY